MCTCACEHALCTPIAPDINPIVTTPLETHLNCITHIHFETQNQSSKKQCYGLHQMHTFLTEFQETTPRITSTHNSTNYKCTLLHKTRVPRKISTNYKCTQLHELYCILHILVHPTRVSRNNSANDICTHSCATCVVVWPMETIDTNL